MHIAGEDFYRFLVEQSREILCYHDATGKNIYVSPAMKDLCGFDPEEITGQNPYDFIHPDDWDYVQRFGHMPALTGTEVTTFEYRFRKKGGGYIWLQTLLQPIKGPDGAVQRLISSSRDITHEVELRELLKRNETLLDEACRMACIGAWEYHPADQTMTWSKIIYDIHELDTSFKPTYENCFLFFPESAQEKLQALHLLQPVLVFPGLGNILYYPVQLEYFTVADLRPGDEAYPALVLFGCNRGQYQVI